MKCQYLLFFFSCLSLTAGCEKSAPPEFRFNSVERVKQERLHLAPDSKFDPIHQTEIEERLTSLFGTPDLPTIPTSASALFNSENLALAAGSVNSDKTGTPRGLYREHCAQCHGISGDGAGPVAVFQNPYPRDFRFGKFKFKSTPQQQPPTDEDLVKILRAGIPGTAMPSFAILSDQEIDALTDYVKYLAVRGQFERFLIAELPDMAHQPLKDQDFSPQLNDIISKWLECDQHVTPVPQPPAALAPEHAEYPALVEQGKKLFLSTDNCLQCHGEAGRGDGQVNNFDDWTNNWLNSPGIKLYDPATRADFYEAGALKPRPILPRNLQMGIYRGGGRPEDLFRRISNGIEGTPMPSSTTYSAEEIWALVAYVKSLSTHSGTR